MPDGGVFQSYGADERARVLLLLPSLQGGGAERVAAHLLNRCDPSLVNVRMGLLQRTGPYLADVDPHRVDASPIGHDWLGFQGDNSSFYRPHRLVIGGVLAPVNTAAMIRGFRPDVAISFVKGMNIITRAALPLLGPDRPRWIAREGNNTYAVIDDELTNPLGRAVVKRAMRNCYRTADCVLANSADMAEGLKDTFGLSSSKVRVIHNPIDVARIQTLSNEPMADPPSRPFIVAAGRLEYQKAHDLLLEAFAKSAACKDLDLVILGKGSREERLKAQAAELGIADRVHFRGFAANPWAYFSKARMFVLPSRWEGFPTVVVEALACGAPTLVTDCCYGPKEIVEHGESGWIVPRDDVAAFGKAMDTILTHPELAARFSAGGKRRALQFDVDKMVLEYTTLFIEQAVTRRAAMAPRIGALQSAWS